MIDILPVARFCTTPDSLKALRCFPVEKRIVRFIVLSKSMSPIMAGHGNDERTTLTFALCEGRTDTIDNMIAERSM